ncbi:DUF2057 domain-containing protein [Vibrio algarum]|uniref:Uncharacterized protein n=1 Tax=Vibrio algarum TaxID=3020714 RepID=A0ABT4YQH6_9VIBR|nr:hypothetical protein [Vibrio sp. KJ40-1]MDB1123630.1 hypothetical protein [Vibrio sp. KJ40-1]
MKHLKIITLAIVSSISFSALSSVELTANSSLELLVVNGEKAKVDSSFFPPSRPQSYQMAKTR